MIAAADRSPVRAGRPGHRPGAAGAGNDADRAAQLLAQSSKQDIGALVRQQQLGRDLPWLSHLASLREMRTAHSTPRGSTTPLSIDDSDATATLSLTRWIVEGWIPTMYRLKKQPLPAARP